MKTVCKKAMLRQIEWAVQNGPDQSFLLPLYFFKSDSSISSANICWCWRRFEDVMSWRRLQHVFSIKYLNLPRRLQNILEDKILLPWRCLQDVLKTLWRQTKYLLVISVSNKSKCVSNKSIFHKSISDDSKANPKCMRNLKTRFILELEHQLYFKN